MFSYFRLGSYRCVNHDKIFFIFTSKIPVGPAGFEPATSSARGWHPAKLDNGPRIARALEVCRIISLLTYLLHAIKTDYVHLKEPLLHSIVLLA